MQDEVKNKVTTRWPATAVAYPAVAYRFYSSVFYLFLADAAASFRSLSFSWKII